MIKGEGGRGSVGREGGEGGVAGNSRYRTFTVSVVEFYYLSIYLFVCCFFRLSREGGRGEKGFGKNFSNVTNDVWLK